MKSVSVKGDRIVVRIRLGEVAAIRSSRNGIKTVTVIVDGQPSVAINYDDLTGPIAVGDQVILNTTAKHLGLGTGGTHFVMGIIGTTTEPEGAGHIMKCRYTPSQLAVMAVEEEESPYHAVLEDGHLDGIPVVVATLHSMVAAFAVAAKERGTPDLRIVYVMTDGAALPAKFSNLTGELKEKGYLDAVITYGQAFGGDYEAVTLYSALLAAKVVCRADLIIVSMGPGVVGTGTRWGTTALEQGPILDGVHALGGRAIAVPRLSFADPRNRHKGISHHSLTALGQLAMNPCEVALPSIEGEERSLVYEQLEASGVLRRHRVTHFDAWFVVELLSEKGIAVTTMGRTPKEDPALFASAAAGAMCAIQSG